MSVAFAASATGAGCGNTPGSEPEMAGEGAAAAFCASLSGAPACASSFTGVVGCWAPSAFGAGSAAGALGSF